MASITTKPSKSLSTSIAKLHCSGRQIRCSKIFHSFNYNLKIHVGFCSYKNRSLNVIHKGNAIQLFHIHRAKDQPEGSALSYRCAASGPNCEIPTSSEHGFDSHQGRLLKNVGIVGLATTISKILGLLRETVLAATFGIGPVVTAFNYALIIPSFFISLLGGTNGPLHTTITAALSKRSTMDGKRLIEKINAIVFLASAALGIAVFIFADTIIHLAAPGLSAVGGNHGDLIRYMATIQLKIMTPCILFAGPLGVGFGCLNSTGNYHIPSLIPSLSSMAIIFAIAIHFLRCKANACASQTSFSGAILLASGASVGALLQWLVQAYFQREAGFSVLRTLWTNPFIDADMRELFAVVLPAIVGSDANLLAMAPLGILSSSILLPLLPILSQLSKPSLWPRLKERLKQGVLLCMVVTLPLIAVILTLAKPIVEVVFQRFAFDAHATASVSSLLICYILGSPFYLVRDLLIRVFYALDNGKSPFQISVAAIILNAFLDWLFISKMGFGAEGLVIATSLVTVVSMAILMGLLSNKIRGLNLKEWITPSLLLVASCVLSTIITASVHARLYAFFSHILSARAYWISQLLSILLASSMGVLSFLFPLWWLQLQGLQIMRRLNYRD
ncbi:uncharacterized protein LOC131044844 isoform X2 [Cryptomeria japonica]|uniref:uncharacterized protein LOC131044844 isoform X2 n=1 Tax=Cryptomeria japonica TaxID=3369 RepID=UPI0027DAA141|nr:uncharacterized protein LOC131044844 isoform X2 [Cryptomeria japonica]